MYQVGQRIVTDFGVGDILRVEHERYYVYIDFSQDINVPKRTYEDEKQMIRDMLEKVLDNPEEYRPIGHIGCLLRYHAN